VPKIRYMAVEIERKFLVAGDFPFEKSVPMLQGYLSRGKERTVRVRTEGGRAVITIKGATAGISRVEFEYEIPMSDALEMMKLATGSLVKKRRHYHQVGNHTWEIDVFEGENSGLVVAEIELQYEHEEFEKPDWVGAEVTRKLKYANSALSENPYSNWD